MTISKSNEPLFICNTLNLRWTQRHCASKRKVLTLDMLEKVRKYADVQLTDKYHIEMIHYFEIKMETNILNEGNLGGLDYNATTLFLVFLKEKICKWRLELELALSPKCPRNDIVPHVLQDCQSSSPKSNPGKHKQIV